jgi:hypothetical protein
MRVRIPANPLQGSEGSVKNKQHSHGREERRFSTAGRAGVGLRFLMMIVQ